MILSYIFVLLFVACSAHGGEKRSIQGFGGENQGKETTWKNQALMGE
jgi:hypothetical protein